MTRAFVIGAGKSLRKVDFDLLKPEVTLAMNRIDLLYEPFDDGDFHWPGTDWRPTHYLFTENMATARRWGAIPEGHFCDYVVLKHMDGGEDCYIRWEFRNEIDNWCKQHGRESRAGKWDFPNVTWLDIEGCPHQDMNIAHPDKPRRWHLPTICKFGGTGLAAIQTAFAKGYDPIYLVGFDLDYRYAPDDYPKDPNHFHPLYWTYDSHPPDERDATLIWAHKIARREIEGMGRRVYNAGIGGRLEVYERVDLTSLFGG